MLSNNRAVAVKALKNYILLIKFADGTERIYNCHCLLQQKLYSELSDQSFFKTVHIDEMGVICWDNALDINPKHAYEDSISLCELHF